MKLYAGVRSDLTQKKKELREQEAKLNALVALKPIIERSIAEMGDIGKKLAVLSALWGTVRRTDVGLKCASTYLYILQFEQDANDIRARLVAAQGTDVSNPILTDPYQY